MEIVASLNDNIQFTNPQYPISIVPYCSFLPYDPKNPTGIFHEEMEIKLILSGKSTMMINGTIHAVSPGDIVVVNPYEPHYTIDTGEAPAVYHLYMFSLDFLKMNNPHNPDLRYKMLGEKICFQNVIRDDPRLQQILLSIQQEMAEKDENWQLVLSNLLTEFIVLLLRKYINPIQTNTIQITSLKNYESILPALGYINTNYAEKITIEELAELCRLSKYYFCRLFKQVTGQTVIEYINQYRMKLANYMIQNHDLTKVEIARRCGFPDVNYFYRIFKKTYGHTSRDFE